MAPIVGVLAGREGAVWSYQRAGLVEKSLSSGDGMRLASERGVVRVARQRGVRGGAKTPAKHLVLLAWIVSSQAVSLAWATRPKQPTAATKRVTPTATEMSVTKARMTSVNFAWMPVSAMPLLRLFRVREAGGASCRRPASPSVDADEPLLHDGLALR